ncbi:dienelactone hydrolase family protein [Aspergillus melleus]|uniref:dienelactone hydrolase family protein n=1 Tax=Aspergillus melleus TaxID=138277 RepID=UPI001E8D9810|nr:uncharacterized protein LDX57_000216 [Aspergillus melleus]KAH8422461.1 hypothetical protein LDX57_000216 [Aspergillus melleus]
MSSDCCKSGFKWEGIPTGTEATFAGTRTYITGQSKSAAILYIHDIFGWKFPNARVLADYYAEKANATVYVPDFFDGEIVSPEMLEDPVKRASFSIPDFAARHSKDLRWPTILNFATELRKQYDKVGTIGFCYGGWAVFRLGARDLGLVDCISAAHPSMLEDSEIGSLAVPTQILSPEHDFAFTEELKDKCNIVIPRNNIPYEYVYFPGLAHGFATRGDRNDDVQKKGLERAARSAVGWFGEWLH